MLEDQLSEFVVTNSLSLKQLSKASMLQKGAEYIKQLRSERAVIGEQVEGLKKEVELLTNSLK